MNNINFYNKPIIVLLLSLMYGANAYCMEKDSKNWIVSLCFLSDSEENVSQREMPRYVHSRNESGINIIELRKQYERIVLASRYEMDGQKIMPQRCRESIDDFDIHYTK